MRPFRFGLQAARVNDPDEWLALARCAEETGYSCFMVPDHLGRLAAFPALMAAATVTRRIKLATFVLNQDWRPPGILAQEAATVQLLTGGRLELGIGAGWAEREYRQVGIVYDSAGVRISRFAEYLEVVRGALHATAPFSYEGNFFRLDQYVVMSPVPAPPPPLLMGGGSPRILAIGARLADIISVSTRATPDGRVDMSNIRVAAVEDKVARIREAAGERFSRIELNMTVRELRLTDDRARTARELLNEWSRVPNRYANVEQLSEDDVLDSPHMAIGTVEQIVEQFEISRERWGFAYLEVGSTEMEAAAPVLERLNGR